MHIKTFSELMDRKGYDGHYLSSFGFPDKLKDNLTQHVLQCFEEKKAIGPLNLSTYSKWVDNESPYVRCDFSVDFNDTFGFKVLNMSINYANEYGPIRSREISFNRNSEIPDREQANRMVMERKKSLRL